MKTEKFIEIFKKKKQGFSRAANLIIFMNIISETFFLIKWENVNNKNELTLIWPKLSSGLLLKNLINKCKSIESEKSTKTNYLCQKNEQLWSTYNQLICYFYTKNCSIN